MSSRRPPQFTQAQIESISKALGDTNTGLTGSEIGWMLAQARIDDIDPTNTKWKRLHNALVTRHTRDRHGDRVLGFIRAALDPGRYTEDPTEFEERKDRVNIVLAFHGLEFRDDGRFHTVAVATTLTEAEGRANRLRQALQSRGFHQDMIRFCRAEFLQNDCFHAVLEASKSVAEKIRQKTGLTSDGAQLVDEALGGATPQLRINAFATDTQKSEQRGFCNLAKGLFGTFRNPTAHAPRIQWSLDEQDALDLFALASYIHRRVDSAVRNAP